MSATMHTEPIDNDGWIVLAIAILHPKKINATTASQLYEDGYAQKIPPSTPAAKARMLEKKKERDVRRSMRADDEF